MATFYAIETLREIVAEDMTMEGVGEYHAGDVLFIEEYARMFDTKNARDEYVARYDKRETFDGQCRHVWTARAVTAREAAPIVRENRWLSGER